jgi:Ca2+-binding RTX toxin-like protein
MFIPSTGFYLRDFNSDGQMDFGLAHFSLQIETPGSYIFINTGDGFDQATHANGVSNNTGWDDPGIIPIFDDFDNDGDVDIAGFRALGYTSFYTDVLENNLIQTLSGNNDQFTGTEYRDIVYSSDGNDLAQANAGDDLLWGQSGNDTLSGGAGDDLIYGNQDADRIVGGTGMDTLFGGQQSDIAFGLTGADQVYGNKQNDTLYGGVGDDSMFGGQNDDLVFGEVGNDRMDGNRGSDTLFGGDGADRFVISKGNDVVQDFSVAEDRIETLDAFSAINQAVINGSLVLTDTDGDTLTLIGISSRLTEEYFI